MRFEHCLVQTLQTFNPHVLKQFLQINESFLRPKFPEPRKSSRLNKGRPRIGPRWVIVALSILGRLQNISWRNMPDQFSSCQFLINEGYLKNIPRKSTFHATWNSIQIKSLESWTRRLGYTIAKQSDYALACDSTGFKRVGSSLWGYLKWVPTRLSKTSKIFVKAHICISLPSRAIIAICFSRSIDKGSGLFVFNKVNRNKRGAIPPMPILQGNSNAGNSSHWSLVRSAAMKNAILISVHRAR